MTNQRMIRVALACLVFGSIALAGEAEEVKDPLKLLGVLAAAQRENFEKIRSFDLTMTEHLTCTGLKSGDEAIDRSSEYRECMRDQCLYVESSLNTVIGAANGTKRAQNLQQRMVINDHYLANWLVGMASAYMYEYDSMATMSRRATAESRGLNPRQPLRYGFKDGDMSLQELHDWIAGPNKGSLTIVRQGNIYKVTLFEERVPLEEITVDGKKGYLISHVIVRDDGVLDREISVQAKEIKPGIWFPNSWEQTEYIHEEHGGAKPAIRNHSYNEVKAIQINVDIPRENFEWPALKLPTGVRITRVDGSGEPSSMTISNGELVPQGMVRQPTTRKSN